MAGEAEVIVVGAGQAGLAASRELGILGIDHLVLERARVGETWRRRWDSFCLVTPNWTMSLPGFAYAGDEPEGHVPRDEIVRYLEAYADSFRAPVHEGVDVRGVTNERDADFVLQTSAGELRARQLVIATGAFQRPHRPPVASQFPGRLLVCDAEDYTNPHAVPPGAVLIVGSGQTGCQLAEELHEGGREVFLACGRASWLPRRLEGRDIVTWLSGTDFFEAPLKSLPSPLARLAANPQVTGRNGGHNLNYRVLQASGVHLLGRLIGVEGGTAHFASDLADSVAFGDMRYAEVCKLLRDQLPAQGLSVPEMPQSPAFVADPPLELPLRGFGAVIFTSGFRPDYARWLHFPAFDEWGFPLTDDGASTVVPGLYFVGTHFLRKRKSSLLFGVGEDAAIVACKIAGCAGGSPASTIQSSREPAGLSGI